MKIKQGILQFLHLDKTYSMLSGKNVFILQEYFKLLDVHSEMSINGKQTVAPVGTVSVALQRRSPTWASSFRRLGNRAVDVVTFRQDIHGLDSTLAARRPDGETTVASQAKQGVSLYCYFSTLSFDSTSPEYVFGSDIQFYNFLHAVSDLNRGHIYNVFDMLDVDGSGRIDFDEFYLLICILISLKDKEEKQFIYRHSRTVFELLDEDRSHSISAEEFSAFGFLFNFHGKAVNQIFKDFDISGDEELDYKEFKMFAMACIDKQNEIDRRKRENVERRRRRKIEKARRKLERVELGEEGNRTGWLARTIPACDACIIQ